MSAMSLEREVKLRFDSVEEARRAVIAAGCTPRLGRRLQADAMLDTDDEPTLHERIKTVERSLLVDVVGRMARDGWTLNGRKVTIP